MIPDLSIVYPIREEITQEKPVYGGILYFILCTDEIEAFKDPGLYLFLMDILSETASENFGITYFLPYQRLVITNILRRAGYLGMEVKMEVRKRRKYRQTR